MPKIVWHVGAWSNNYGDRALQVGNTNILKEHCGKETQFVYIDTQKTYFSEALINKMNAEADLLYIGGGGLIFHRPMDHSHSGWQFNIDTKNISKIKIPIAVYGIGYNKFPYDEHVFTLAMWQNLGTMVNRADFFSVRNEGTYNIMAEHGIGVDLDKVCIVPDAGMFIKPDPFSHPCLEGDHIKIGINWATDRPEQRFGNYDESLIALHKMLNICEDLAVTYNDNIKFYFIEHLVPNDLCSEAKADLRKAVHERLGDKAFILYDEIEEELFPPFDYTVGLFADIYRQMDVVFGMRGHANIIPFGQNTPFIGVGTHNKVKWFLEEVGCADNFVSLDEEYYFAYAHDIVGLMISNPLKYKKQMAVMHRAMGRIKDVFMKQVAGILK